MMYFYNLHQHSFRNKFTTINWRLERTEAIVERRSVICLLLWSIITCGFISSLAEWPKRFPCALHYSLSHTHSLSRLLSFKLARYIYIYHMCVGGGGEIGGGVSPLEKKYGIETTC